MVTTGTFGGRVGALVLAALIALFGAVATGAAIIHVPVDQPTIQSGVDAASYGDTVMVACGTYYEHDLAMKSGVTLRSTTGEPECVTIDAQQQGRVIYCYGVDAAAAIQGLTLTRGKLISTSAVRDGGGMYCRDSGLSVSACVFTGNTGRYGGGMFCRDSAVTVSRCVFTGNEATWGSGAACKYGGPPSFVECSFSSNSAGGGRAAGAYCSMETAARFIKCVFEDNVGHGLEADGYAAPLIEECRFSRNESALGGGAYLYMSSATLTRCTFVGNRCSLYGAGVMVENGSNHIASPVATISDCLFEGNVTDYCGGGLAVECACPVITNCTFIENMAEYGGGAYASVDSGPSISNCEFIGNTAGYFAGGLGFYHARQLGSTVSGCLFRANTSGNSGAIRSYDSSVLIHGCTVVEDDGLAGAAIAADGGSVLHVTNTIIAFSRTGPSASCDGTSSITLACSDAYGNGGGDWTGCIATQLGLSGNICADPLFCGEDMPTSPFSLGEMSPCAPAANPVCGLIGAYDVACGWASSRPSSWGAIKALFR
jgi:hypothetical protein